MARYLDITSQAGDKKGKAIDGATLSFFEAGPTTTFLGTFQDEDLTIPNTNPVVADGQGRFPDIWLKPQKYYVEFRDADGVLLDAQDDVTGPTVSGATTLVNIAALTVLVKSSLLDGEVFQVDGYLSQGDGGGGDFFWDSASTATEDEVEIFESDEGGTGRWFRIITNNTVDASAGGMVYGDVKANGVTNGLRVTDLASWAVRTGGTIVVSGGVLVLDRSFILSPQGGGLSLTDLNDCEVHVLSGSSMKTWTTGSGADVLQINSAKNLKITIDGLLETQIDSVTGSWSGTNGVSITNGGENIRGKVRAKDLRFRDAGPNGDGGKAFTIQPTTSANVTKDIIFDVYATGDSDAGTGLQAFGMDLDGPTSLTNPPTNIVIGSCVGVGMYRLYAIGMSDSATTTNIIPAMNITIVSATGVNCQQGGVLGRVTNVNIGTTHLSSTKTGTPTALAADTNRIGFDAAQCFNSRFGSVTGHMAECVNFVRVGGSTAASATVKYSDENSIGPINYKGTCSDFTVLAFNSGGNTVRNTFFNGITGDAGSSGLIDPVLFNSTNNNTIIAGSTTRFAELLVATNGDQDTTTVNAVINGSFGPADTDGKNCNQFFEATTGGNNIGIAAKQIASSDTLNVNFQVQDNSGNLSFGFTQDGQLRTKSRAGSGAVGAASGFMNIFDEATSTTYKIALFA